LFQVFGERRLETEWPANEGTWAREKKRDLPKEIFGVDIAR